LKKAALVLLALALFGFTAAFAQTTLAIRTHGASVTVPGMAFIRFTLGTSTADVAAPDGVEFTMTTGTYDVGTFNPTNASFNWDDIRVFYNGTAAWEVVVSTTGASTGFDWSKVGMTPTGAGVSPYDLDGTPDTIVSDTGKTNGWRALGIDPTNYQVNFDGSEDPGTYSNTVVFTLQNP
jgi:hypothetical protein